MMMPKGAEMPNMSAVSLQHKLVKTSVLSSVLAGLIALTLLFALTIYQTMTIQDEIMDEISDMLLVSDLSSRSGSEVDELSEQFEIQYQLFYQQNLLTQSNDFDPQWNQSYPIFFQHDHLGLAWIDGALVRVYSMTNDDQTLKMYQPIKVRFHAVLESVLSFAVILLILWLLQWLILYFSVKKQFKSIHRLSRDISEKTAQDLTPIVQDQPEFKELQPMVKQLNQMLMRLDQSLLAEQRFTSDASHELRSPLSAIQMRLQLLKRKYQNEGISDDLDQIQVDVSRGTNVLENLLLLARLDPSQQDSLPRAHVDLKLVIIDVLKALEPFSNAKNIRVDLNVTSTIIRANSELIFSCVRNIIDNAIRYTTENGLIHIGVEQHQETAKVIVRNSGEPVSEETITRMGERFYRELGTKTQGSGLGLSICKKIIELHQGSIEFNHPSQGGLEVIVHLPKSFE